MSPHGRTTAAVWTASVISTAVILGPLLGPGYFLWRDAVSTPRSFVTDPALGIGDLPPRAVPQDWFIAILSQVVDGGLAVRVVMALGLILLGAGCGRLASVVIPASRTPGAVVATLVGIWNPFVAERLLQGHWSLLFGVGMLSWLAVQAIALARGNYWGNWVALAGMLAMAGLTPTGSLMGVVVALVAASTTTAPRRIPLGIVGVWLMTASPWLVGGLVGAATATSDPLGVSAFAARAEPGLGTAGAVMGLGGIWNAEAVPASRQFWWAAVATIALLSVVVSGTGVLWRRRRIGALSGTVILAVAVVILVAAGATAPGQTVLRFLVSTVPGAGLLRDSQKWLGLAIPGFAVCAAAGVQQWGRWLPRGFIAAAAMILVVAPLPDLAWGVGGALQPIRYPAEFATVAAEIPSGQGDVVIIPSGTNRRFAFNGGRVSLDPLPRMVRTPVVQSGELIVNNTTVDKASGRAGEVARVIASGGPAKELARLGVGWIVAEGNPIGIPGTTDISGVIPALAGSNLHVYQIANAARYSASNTVRILALSAHTLWSIIVVAGIIAIVSTRSRLGAGAHPPATFR